MKILLTAVNAKYIHSNLAVYCLKAYADIHLNMCGGTGAGRQRMDGVDIELAEYTVNQQIDDILRDIYKRMPDVLCFSCYIWNMEYVDALVREIAKLRPEMPIWLGGPEVSYDSADVLRRLLPVRGVMKGEGEETFTQLCKVYRTCTAGKAPYPDAGYTEEEAGNVLGPDAGYTEEEAGLAGIEGITYRDVRGRIRENPPRQAIDLDSVPFVYESMKDDPPDLRNKIIYYESSRGCPFSCSYCLSSIDRQMRFRDLELVQKELQFFIDREVPQVKFVDRTFNCRHEHAIAIWRYIAEHDRGITNFHFEVAADLLNEEELGILEGMRPGLVQLEAGVQSTNPDTLREIRRRMDFGRVRTVVERIRQGRNIHQHLDLIAGLPYEDIASFARSFDDVYALEPEQLQLGFLKVLKGSYMDEKRREYGIVCQSRPPREVLFTRWMSYEDMIRLKGIEEMVEVYHNSGQFRNTLKALAAGYPSAFQMFDGIYRFYEKYGYEKQQHKRSARYEILLRYVEECAGTCTEETEYFRELLICDYYLRENAKSRPPFAGEYKVTKEFLRAFYENEEAEHRYLYSYMEYDRSQMRRMTHLEYFPIMGKYILFDYMERDILTQNARTCVLQKCGKEYKM